ncbi:MAG TPA: UDP-N-acetylmuramoyl-L-alanine--D-glutamate ligase [Firmicutes bacterium]|nr:UDP-N-acetylmuramoyl-L-alanine--D-glutamate ligase [Bacillota bacterium]
MRLEGKRIALVGLGVSNLALARYLHAKGLSFEVRDKKRAEQLEDKLSQLPPSVSRLILGDGYLDGLEQLDLVFLTPGMRKDFPEIRHAVGCGTVFSSEMALFVDQCRAPICGITGSAGKTTTTSLIGEMLRRGISKRVYVGGNIGNPLIELVDSIEPEAVVVLELSSFQLQMMTKSPHVAVLLNISPNHLDVHASMEEYVEAKSNIFKHHTSCDHLVVNADEPGAQSAIRGYPYDCLQFSRLHAVERGAFLDDGLILLTDGNHSTTVLPASQVRIPGLHNLENVLAACCASSLFGCSVEAMAQVASTFPGVEHRLEFVREIDGVTYINDSIATTPERTMAAIATVTGPVVLIAGGYDKHLPFDHLAEKILQANIPVVLTLGVTAPKIEEAISRAAYARPSTSQRRVPAVIRCEDLKEAVYKAREYATPGYTVLLSPACASYDMFRNFEERGRLFKKLVYEL